MKFPSLPSLASLLLCAFALTFSPGCALRPLKGGRAVTSHIPGGGLAQFIGQSENPSQPSRQSQETIKIRTYTLPPGDARAHGPDPSVPALVTEREETRAATELGAAQKDTAREIGAKLASLKGIVWVGVLLFIFGIASLAYPPLRAIIGSITTSVAIILGGLALMVLPTLIVGNELLILGGVALIVGAWFFAHRHGQLRGQLTAVASSAAKKRAAK